MIARTNYTAYTRIHIHLLYEQNLHDFVAVMNIKIPVGISFAVLVIFLDFIEANDRIVRVQQQQGNNKHVVGIIWIL